jgi:hypothetical protein
MEVRGQLRAPAALSSGVRAPGTHWIRGWVGSKAGLDSEKPSCNSVTNSGNSLATTGTRKQFCDEAVPNLDVIPIRPILVLFVCFFFL